MCSRASTVDIAQLTWIFLRVGGRMLNLGSPLMIVIRRSAKIAGGVVYLLLKKSLSGYNRTIRRKIEIEHDICYARINDNVTRISHSKNIFNHYLRSFLNFTPRNKITISYNCRISAFSWKLRCCQEVSECHMQQMSHGGVAPARHCPISDLFPTS